MPHKAVPAGRQAKKHGVAVRIKKKKIKEEDLLPESKEFLSIQTGDEPLEPSFDEIDVLEKEDKYKRVIMWAGISFFMILILFVWALNFKNSFDKMAVTKKSGQSWEDFSKEINKAMFAIQQEADKLNQVAATTTATSTIDTFSAASIAELKKELEATSTVATTTSATITTKNTKKK